MDSKPGTLDYDLKHKKVSWLDPNYTTGNTFDTCKSTLCRLIECEKYEEAIMLYDQIISTGIYDISGCWMTGLELVKKTGRDSVAYLEAAHRVCRSKKKITIFLAYIDALMEAGRTDAIEENIDTIWVAVHGHNPDVKDIRALLHGVKSTENWINYLKYRCENVPRRSQYNPRWIPSDEAVVTEYLDMLRGRDPDALKDEATTVLSLAGQESDLKLLKLTLKYYTPPLQPFDEWLSLMSPVHRLDPIADPSIFAEPFFEACIGQFEFWDVGNPETFTEYRYICDLLKIRLEKATYDKWTNDKLSWLCSVIMQMRTNEKATYARLLNAEKLSEVIDSKLDDLGQEQQSDLEALKKSGKRDEMEMMRIVGSFQLKISAFKQLQRSLDNVYHIVTG